MNLLDAIRTRRPMRRPDWPLWCYLTTAGRWCAVPASRLQDVAADPELWPHESYTPIREDYLATDWEILP